MYYWRPAALKWLHLAGCLNALPQFKQLTHLFVVQREWFPFVCLQHVSDALLVAEGDEPKAPGKLARA